MNDFFYGYARADGSAGVRNHLLILSVAQCVDVVARRMADELPGAVTFSSAYGCSQIGSDAEQTFRTFCGFACNPNVGACIVVGLKCAQVDGAEIALRAAAGGKPVKYIDLDAYASHGEAIVEACRAGLSMAKELSTQTRTKLGLERLVLGLECGGSDAWSGLSANPVTGEASDLLIEQGGTAILSESQEMIGAEAFFAAKAISPRVRDDFLRVVKLREDESIEGGVDIASVNPSPGNKAGGLTTLEEKSLGCMQKGGRRSPLMEVLDYAAAPTQRGLIFMDTPGDDVESITGMVAGGCQVVVFTTGRGTCVGNPIVPVIKVASNTPLYERMSDNLDFNAGVVVDGRASIESCGAELFRAMIRVCGGEKTKSEILGCEGNFSITRTGITL